MSDCPCVCHWPSEIEADLQRQLQEEDAAVLRRIRDAGLDVHQAMTEPIPGNPEGRSILRQVMADNWNHPTLVARRVYDERTAEISRLRGLLAQREPEIRELRRQLRDEQELTLALRETVASSLGQLGEPEWGDE